MQKKFSVETGEQCPFEFKQINEPSLYRGKYRFSIDSKELIKKEPKEIKIIAISCKEKHSIRKE